MKITKSLLKRIIKDEIHKINENNSFDTQKNEKIIDEKIETLKAISKGSITKTSFLIDELERLLEEISELADVMPPRR